MVRYCFLSHCCYLVLNMYTTCHGARKLFTGGFSHRLLPLRVRCVEREGCCLLCTCERVPRVFPPPWRREFQLCSMWALLKAWNYRDSGLQGIFSAEWGVRKKNEVEFLTSFSLAFMLNLSTVFFSECVKKKRSWGICEQPLTLFSLCYNRGRWGSPSRRFSLLPTLTIFIIVLWSIVGNDESISLRIGRYYMRILVFVRYKHTFNREFFYF